MIKRFNPDFSLSISHELAYMRETPEGGYVEYGDYATLFAELEMVKADRDALEQRVNALAVENGQLKEMNSSLCSELQEYESDNDDFGPAPQSVVNCFALLTPNTDAALAAIEARVLPPNIAEIIDSGELETICYGHEHPQAESIRLALYNFRRLREAK